MNSDAIVESVVCLGFHSEPTEGISQIAVGRFSTSCHVAVLNNDGALHWDHFDKALLKDDPSIDIAFKRAPFNEVCPEASVQRGVVLASCIGGFSFDVFDWLSLERSPLFKDLFLLSQIGLSIFGRMVTGNVFPIGLTGACN